MALGQIAADRGPGASPVHTLEHIGLEVTTLVVVEHGKHGIGVVHTGLEIGYVGVVRDTGKEFSLSPGPSPVLGDLDKAVIRTHVEQSLLQR